MKPSLKVTSPTTYPLDEVAQAHRDIQGGKTTGSVVLTL
ncbi:zinc-binding dehydrogenase [Burkholderia multivorans]|nr:zinc-binding dehydrogenase [Burkholderia multivorans]